MASALEKALDKLTQVSEELIRSSIYNAAAKKEEDLDSAAAILQTMIREGRAEETTIKGAIEEITDELQEADIDIDSLKLERDRLAPLRQNANIIFDTSNIRARALKKLLQEWFALVDQPSLTVCLASFGFKNGLPRDADLVFDVRFLRNPFYETRLREQTGQNTEVGAYIEQDDCLEPFFQNLTALLSSLIPRYASEGKSNLFIAIGCTGGQHRSVYVSERLNRWLANKGHFVQLSHRDLEMREK